MEVVEVMVKVVVGSRYLVVGVQIYNTRRATQSKNFP